MPLPFNKKLDLKLIDLVKENTVLYNSKHTKYLDFDTREVAWQRIGDILNRPAQSCKTRWVNIRDMMRRKIRDRIRNPNNRGYHYKYEDQLSFMIPYFKEGKYPAPEDEYPEYNEECALEMPPELAAAVDAVDFARDREMKPIKSIRLKRIADSVECSQDLNPGDPLDVFLMTIGSTLRKFSPYYLNQAKSKIFQVVQDYELQQIVASEDEGDHDNR